MVKAKLQIGSVKYNCQVPDQVFDDNAKVSVHNGYLHIHLKKLLTLGKSEAKDINVKVSCCLKCSKYKLYTISMENSTATALLKTLRKQNAKSTTGRHQYVTLERLS